MANRNPFFSGSVESIESNSNFLTLLNISAIEYISPTALNKTVFFRSTPGAGKSSIFRLFTPSVLAELVDSTNPNHSEARVFLKSLGAIDENCVKIMGIWISCSHGYKVIDDLYSNGRRSQIFFALLNLRILRSAIQGAARLHNLEISEYKRIKFVYVPPELTSCIEPTWNGEDVFLWARNEENKIMRSFDNFDETYPIPFPLSSLSFFPLINANNMLLDGDPNTPVASKTLIMIDDIQFLTTMQQKELREQILIQKSTVSIWLAERLSQLNSQEILGNTGKERRDYLEFNVEKHLREIKSPSFLSDIADRRIRSISEYESSIGTFSACLSEEIDRKEIKKNITPYLRVLEKELFSNSLNVDIHKYYISHHKYVSDDYQAAIFLRAVKILVARNINKLGNQITFLSPAQLSYDEIINQRGELTSKMKSLLNPAEFYLCCETKTSYYYGKERIQKMYSYNIEQFLDIAGEIFERRIANNYSSPKKISKQVNAAEQESIIFNLAQKKWDKIRNEFLNYQDVYNLLENIVSFGTKSRDRGLAAYAGGAFTGIGIPSLSLAEYLENCENSRIINAFVNAIASNYLLVSEQKHRAPDEKWTVFHLNRWICSLFWLPLSYGGWKEVNSAIFTHLIDKNIHNSIADDDDAKPENLSLFEKVQE